MTNLHLIKLKKPLKLEIHSNFHQNKTCSKSRHNLQDYILPFTHVPMLVFLVLKMKSIADLSLTLEVNDQSFRT